MGKFDKRREEKAPRRYGFRKPSAESHLIVTEGEETEPHYFEKFSKYIKENIGGTIDTVTIPEFTIEGKGRSTKQLLYEVDKIINKSSQIYKYVWVIFDKDKFKDFDDAIKIGNDKGYFVAWNNHCFEYWLVLHFNYYETASDSSTLQDTLSRIFKKRKIANGKYEKNDLNIFENVGGLPGVKNAVRNAKKRMSEYNDSILPSAFNPGTKVYILAEKLLSYLEE